MSDINKAQPLIEIVDEELANQSLLSFKQQPDQIRIPI